MLSLKWHHVAAWLNRTIYVVVFTRSRGERNVTVKLVQVVYLHCVCTGKLEFEQQHLVGFYLTYVSYYNSIIFMLTSSHYALNYSSAVVVYEVD